MELEQLRIFCTVAACRSFTRAAKQLFVSHSTTSRAVSALERELGVPLLARDRHTVALRSRPHRRKRNFGGLHKLFCKISTFERKTLLTFRRVFAILMKRLCGNRCILR
mgnify:CR=1 FL=1